MTPMVNEAKKAIARWHDKQAKADIKRLEAEEKVQALMVERSDGKPVTFVRDWNGNLETLDVRSLDLTQLPVIHIKALDGSWRAHRIVMYQAFRGRYKIALWTVAEGSNRVERTDISVSPWSDNNRVRLVTPAEARNLLDFVVYHARTIDHEVPSA
ncbi:MAG: hypothetical protein KatS3mg082_1452 [Nitrospiraceae bacterium]|nr:MAG: hypothetical protein KatS3mg082_1452 [Nitrospiraceae bacterium]